MKVIHVAAGLVSAVLLAGSAWAGKGGAPVVPTFGKGKKSENEAYVGIQWDMMARSSVTAVLGYRSVDVDSRDKVRGAAAELTYALTGPMAGPGEFRVKGVDGERGSQGELGAGYSFAHRAFLLNGGIQGSHVYGGVDYLFGTGLKPYIGLNTIGRYDRVQRVASCPPNWVFIDGECVD